MKIRKLLAGLLSVGIALQSAVFSGVSFAQTNEALLETVCKYSGGSSFTFTYITDEEAEQIRAELKEARKTPEIGSYSAYMLESYDSRYSNDYYYKQLTGAAKTFFESLEASVRSFASNPVDVSGSSFCEVSYRGVKTDDVFRIYQLFYYSNPQYFFMDQGGAWNGSSFFPAINSSYKKAADLTAAADQLETATTEFFSSISPLPSSDADKSLDVLAVSKKLAENIEYVLSAPHNQSVIGALVDKKCVCNGYTMAVTYLCNYLGIPAIGICSDDHAWNAVQITNSGNDQPYWFLLDVTWMDQGSSLWYDWFCKSTATFYANDSNYSHVPRYAELYDGFVELPVCELDMQVNSDGDGVSWGTTEIHPTPGRPSLPSSGSVVWVNGKDFKATGNSPAQKYKTLTFTHAGKYSGGKWLVTVTPEEIDTVDEFLKLFENGKLTSSGKTLVKEAEMKAKAKLKDGCVTVTSGKKTGYVQVWIYELKKNTETKKNEIVNSGGIAPANKAVNVRAAAGSPVLAEAKDADAGGKLKSGAKGVSKLTLCFKVGEETQETVSLTVLDKKSAYDSKSFKTTEKGDTGSVNYVISSDVLRLTPAKPGKTTITVTNIQSGKSAKVSVTVVNAYKVTFGEGISVSYKSGKDTVVVKSGDYVPEKTKLNVTSGGKDLSVTGGTYKKGVIVVGTSNITISLSSAE